MEKHSNAKFINDPKDYDISLQWIDRTDKFVAFPVRTPKKLRDSIIKVSHQSGVDGSYVAQIGNIYRFIDWIKAEANTPTRRNESDDRDQNHWTGSRSLEHSCEIAIEGEQEINDYVKKESRRILMETKNLATAQFGVERDVEGMYYDVGLYLSGEPEAFYNTADQLIPDRCLDVHIEAVYSAHVDVDHVREQIKNLVAAIASLELSGYRVAVHIWWNTTTDDGYPAGTLTKCLKEHRQPINIPMLVGVTHPAFMRRLDFRVMELLGADCGGYGQCFEHNGHKHSKEIFYLSSDLGTTEEIIKKLKEMKIEL